jgi:adenosylcobinamide kinase/adenosylcobinamide-phosphate guanylyltransferase
MKTASVLVIGAARSGKSRFAQSLAEGCGKQPVLIATAEAYDAEMAMRIEKHKAERGVRWQLVEEPRAVLAAVQRTASSATVSVVDCLTLWLSNLMFAEADLEAAVGELLAAAAVCAAEIVMVTNEVGMGIVPENALARRFRDEAGRLNRRAADQADRVIVMFAGQALTLKGA